jgi:hypothetical protein
VIPYSSTDFSGLVLKHGNVPTVMELSDDFLNPRWDSHITNIRIFTNTFKCSNILDETNSKCLVALLTAKESTGYTYYYILEDASFVKAYQDNDTILLGEITGEWKDSLDE